MLVPSPILGSSNNSRNRFMGLIRWASTSWYYWFIIWMKTRRDILKVWFSYTLMSKHRILLRISVPCELCNFACMFAFPMSALTVRPSIRAWLQMSTLYCGTVRDCVSTKWTGCFFCHPASHWIHCLLSKSVNSVRFSKMCTLLWQWKVSLILNLTENVSALKGWGIKTLSP